MSKQSYSENDPTDDEISDLKCILSLFMLIQNQAYALKELDPIAFQMVGNDNMRWYKCDICDTVYKDDDAEDKAMECCQEYCDECGKDLDDGESGLCEDCQIEEDAEENEDIDSESDE